MDQIKNLTTHNIVEGVERSSNELLLIDLIRSIRFDRYRRDERLEQGKWIHSPESERVRRAMRNEASEVEQAACQDKEGKMESVPIGNLFSCSSLTFRDESEIQIVSFGEIDRSILSLFHPFPAVRLCFPVSFSCCPVPCRCVRSLIMEVKGVNVSRLLNSCSEVSSWTPATWRKLKRFPCLQ